MEVKHAEMVKIINRDLKGNVSEISRRAWEENKLSMPDWEEYGIQDGPLQIKGISEELKEKKTRIKKEETNEN